MKNFFINLLSFIIFMVGYISIPMYFELHAWYAIFPWLLSLIVCMPAIIWWNNYLKNLFK